jgi:hypothetical protein
MTTVEVTQADIDAGTPNTCNLCPIAIALNRALGGAWFVREDEAIPLYAARRPVALPAAATGFIVMFDAREPVEPFAFEFDAEPTPPADLATRGAVCDAA